MLFAGRSSSKPSLPLALMILVICYNNNAQKLSSSYAFVYASLDTGAELFMSTVASETTFIDV